jgi:predicted GIY-YIG superfamily endonuclease
MYRIVCNDLDVKDLYVGSTKNFKVRKNKHKSDSTNEKTAHQKKYQIIARNGGWNNWSMVKIEDFECETKLDANTRERYWLEHYNATMNTVIPSRSDAEYYRQYRQDNKDTIKEYKSQYCQDNRDERFKYSRQYYQDNKDTMNTKHDCDICGGKYTHSSKTRHFKFQKHIIALDILRNVSGI